MLSFLSKSLPPRRSPLFPYTTLFRSTARRGWRSSAARTRRPVEFGAGLDDVTTLEVARAPSDAYRDERRSEEHTSELQSRGHLVCRLLLEIKKLYNKHK